MKLKDYFRAFIFLIFAISCNKNTSKSDALFQKIDSKDSGIEFVNTVENTQDFNIFLYRNFYNGGGVGIGDINNDQLPDIYFTSNLGPNKLYLNKGNFQFEDVSQKAGIEGTRQWSTGVVMVDINQDGWLDIYVCNAGSKTGDDRKNELFINNHDGTFTEDAKKYHLDSEGITTQAAFFDYDLDGDLDAYLLNNSFIPASTLEFDNKRDLRDKDWKVNPVLNGGGDQLLRNDEGVFTDVSEEAHIYGSLIGFGLGVNVSDVNHDAYPDIYISNDFFERDYLYINNQDGTFTESTEKDLGHLSQSSMGADIADINNDGWQDIFTTDMLPEDDVRLKQTTSFENINTYERKQDLGFYHQFMQNSLQLNLGNSHFAEIANYAQVAATDWSWGALIFDMNNDGYKDIMVCNGIYQDLTNQDFMNYFANEIIQDMAVNGTKGDFKDIVSKMPTTPISNYAFQNNHNYTFTNITEEWGLDEPGFSNGASYADLDNDGDLDLVINNLNSIASIYKNKSNELPNSNFIKIILQGEKPNVSAIGAKVNLYSNNQKIAQEIMPTRGFQSSIDYPLTIGLGEMKIDSIEIFWPNKKRQLITSNFKINQVNIYKENEAQLSPEKIIEIQPIFTELPISIEEHDENIFLDFNSEGLILEKLSNEGPAVAFADLNNDGFDDVFIGGAKNQAGQIYMQNAQGFRVSNQFTDDALYEDTAALFADLNGDNTPDLVVGSGGNEAFPNLYSTRLYWNQKGHLVKSATNLPFITNQNTSKIVPIDFDGDKDTDLLITYRNVAGVYGINPQHQLLENDGNGQFTDVTQSRIYKINEVGMITDAAVADLNEDGKQDIIFATDYGHPYIFYASGKRFVPKKSNLDSLSGKWKSVTVADINQDGKPDLILGNEGSNLAFQPKENRPNKLYVADFDQNGTIEPILTHRYNDTDKPVLLKNDITTQIPSSKKVLTNYEIFANSSIHKIFPEKVMSNTIVREYSFTSSVVALNTGNNQFEVKVLPAQAQFSSIYATEPLDINHDGHLDLLIGGNNYGFRPQFGTNDALYGGLLLGNGKGDFTWVNYQNSGFFMVGAIKNIHHLKNPSKNLIFVTINDDIPKLFSYE